MDPLYSLSHITTPQNTHTQALTTQTAAGDKEGAPAGKGEADGDEGRRETDCFGQFSGDPRAKTGHLRLERTSPVLGSLLATMADQTFGNDDVVISEDGNGRLTSSDRFLRAETRGKLQTPLLGFLGDEGSRSQNPSETGTIQADEGTPDSVEEVETTINEKGENLAYDSSSFRAPPRLGFGEASPFINGGRRFEPFNLDKFLKLANAVIDKGDEQTITALRDLKTRWKERFLSVPSLRSGAPETDGNSIDSDLQSPVPEISRLSAGNELALLPPSTDMAAPVKGDQRLTSSATVGIPTSADVASVGDVEGEVEVTVAVDKDGDVTGDASMTSADITEDDITAGNITAYITADDIIADITAEMRSLQMTSLLTSWMTSSCTKRQNNRILLLIIALLREFAKSIWPDLKEVTGTNNGFFFFQFKSVVAMEDVIEGGPWLYQGQPIIFQKWKPGMVLRKLQHTEVLVWIKIRHLPVELWTEEGLSTVASGVGKPLYSDAITRACTRLDFARVCVMLDVTSNLPKHIIIMTPDEEGGESPCKVDVEYEWIPPVTPQKL
ncbi:UNVERIFIED_CONTAM: hypothetical protein Sindi_2935300 [Sesamum indicum]